MRSIFFTLLFIIAGTSHANATVINYGKGCDELGALAADPSKKATAVPFEDIDAAALIKACHAALNLSAADRDLGRYYLQLGRGQLRAGQSADAMTAFENAANLEYPAGHFALGVAYLLGDDVAKDAARAKHHLETALQGQVIWAAKALKTLYADHSSPYFDPEAAKKYQQLFTQNTP